jgi:hypothetical protein
LSGAKSGGIGNASVTFYDHWAIWNNIAGIALHQSACFFISYEHILNFSPLKKAGAGFILPMKYGVGGLDMQKFGDNLYNEIKIGFSYAHCVRNVSLGVKVNYSQISIEGYGNKKNIIAELGGIVRLTERLYFGAHIFNLNQAKIKKAPFELIPVIMKTGLSYRIEKKISLNAEIEKEINFKPILKTGIEYNLTENIFLRTGISSNPRINYFGIGIYQKKYSIDYSFNVNPALGSVHLLSLSYSFNKEK